jgi:tRNA (guanine-N7-)-methyltransferase
VKLEVFRPLEVTWEEWVLRGGPEASFPDPSRPLEVEIGPGEDDFLLEEARARPGTNFLGIEYSRKRVQRYVRRVERLAPGLGNLRLVWRPALDLVGPFLSPGKVAAYHVYFPDPWPKKHHHRYRLLTPELAAALAASLVPGGSVHVSTDHEEYAAEVAAAFAETGAFENLTPPPGYRRSERGPRATAFEERWRAEGRDIFLLDFRTRGA